MIYDSGPWTTSLVVLFVWMALVLGGSILQFGQGVKLELIVSNINYSLIAAPILLLAVVAHTGWWREVGLQLMSNSKLVALVVPGLAIISVWILVFRRGISLDRTLKLTGANTLLIGFSEELMFRGILFYGALASFGSKWAVVITAGIFGSVHFFNGALTGNWKQAAEQAIINIVAGFWLAALRSNLNSIIPLIALHWLWDFGLYAVGRTTVFVKAPSIAIVLPLACQFVLFIYGFWLLYA